MRLSFTSSSSSHSTCSPQPSLPPLVQTVSPDWTPGTGANGRQDLPGVKEGLWDGKKQEAAKFREVDPAKGNKGGLYKMMISVRTATTSPVSRDG